jgi:hypothetical protein
MSKPRRIAWLGLFASVMLTMTWFAKDTPSGRWAASRVFAAAYSIHDPRPEQSGVFFGPEDQQPFIGPSPEEVERTIKTWFPEQEMTVAVEGNQAWSGALTHFRHEDLSSEAVAKFVDQAGDILATDNLFELANRLRSLTLHGEYVDSGSDTDPSRYLALAQRQVPLTCRYFAMMYSALAAAKGYTTRCLGLSRYGDANDHAVCEVYAPEFHKWILVDPDFNIVYRKGGEYLNAKELQTVWVDLKNHLGNYIACSRPPQVDKAEIARFPEWTGVEVVVLGKAGEPLRASNLRGASWTGMNLEFFEYITYPNRNDFLSHHYPFGHPARWQQSFVRAAQQDPWPVICADCYESSAPDSLYWPAGRTNLRPNRGEGNCVVWDIFTWTPNFDHLEFRLDEQAWQRLDAACLKQPLREGRNALEIRSVNRVGLRGEPTLVSIQWHAQPTVASKE